MRCSRRSRISGRWRASGRTALNSSISNSRRAARRLSAWAGSPRPVVPGTGPAVVGPLLLGPIPGPTLGRGETPQAQVERPDVGPEVPDLLLAGSDDLLEVAKGVLQTEPIGDPSQEVGDARLGVGAEEGAAAVRLVHQHDPDDPAGRSPGRPERLVPLPSLLAVEREGAGPPAPLLPGSLGQVDAPLAVDPRPTAPPGRSRLGPARQGGVLA
jgi:hypothetical protein